jgi:hypothetical protein
MAMVLSILTVSPLDRIATRNFMDGAGAEV